MLKNFTPRRSMTDTRQGFGLQLNARQSPGVGKTEREQKMNTFGRRFSTATCLGFVVFQFLLYACKAEAGEIRIAPQSQHLLLNFDHTATFFCQAVGNDAYWSINGRTVPSEGNSSLREQGWTFNETLVEDPGVRHNIHNMTLRIPSKIEFNNTRILCIGVIHDPEYSVPAFLIIKEIHLLIESHTPPIYYTIRNQSITFHCEAIGNSVFWVINESNVRREGETKWKNMGFIFHTNEEPAPMGNEHVYHNTLSLPSFIEHNNTVISCIVLIGNHRPVYSSSVEVIVKGAPSSPVPIPTFDSPGMVILEWDIPFSWPEYPVKSYNIITSNHSELNRDNINETSVQFFADENQNNCEMIEFKVQASSDLGDSDYGSVIAGFPIAPQRMDNSIDITNTALQENGKPQVSMKIKLPKVCSYQSTNYTITIASTDIKPMTRGPFNGTVSSDSVTFTEGLDWGKTYEVTVAFSSSVLSMALEVHKDIYIRPRPVPLTVGPIVPSARQQVPTQYIIIGSAAGGSVLLLVVIVVIIVIIAVHARRRRSMRSWSPSRNGKRPMIANPIYDGGPVYETIPPGPRPPLRLHSNSESSNITATSSVPPTPTSPLPPVPLSTESPYAYAPNQVDPAYAQPHRNGHVNFSFEQDSYMIMNAVQNATAGKRLSEGEESNLDQDGDSGSARYVPEPRQPYASASMV